MTARAQRDPAGERAVLAAAAASASATRFDAHAIDRLDAGQDLYGDRWAELGLNRLIGELLEEAADIGAWGVLALQAHACRAGTDVRDELLDAIAHGAHAYAALERAQARRGGRRSGPTEPEGIRAENGR